jgi:uncharacterized membrane protein
MAESNVSIILWRGVIGGVLGNILKSAVFWAYFSFINTKQSGYLDTTSAVGLFAVLGIPSAIFMSAIIVAVIKSINLKLGRSIGILGGAVIGIGLMCALVIILLLVSNMKLPLDNFSSWIIAAPFYGDFGVIIGATAGMMAGQRNLKMGLRSNRR